MEPKHRIWTIGHSTRSIYQFLSLLNSHTISAVADVRRFPSSRKFPHFNERDLRNSLSEAGIAYLHLPELGGRRLPRPDSPNTRWRNKSFRGYADYMDTDSFRAGIKDLFDICLTKRTAIMCAEAVWWRCHRALIADYLKSKGVEVIHILEASKSEPHPYTAAAKIIDGKLSYVPEERFGS